MQPAETSSYQGEIFKKQHFSFIPIKKIIISVSWKVESVSAVTKVPAGPGILGAA